MSLLLSVIKLPRNDRQFWWQWISVTFHLPDLAIGNNITLFTSVHSKIGRCCPTTVHISLKFQSNMLAHAGYKYLLIGEQDVIVCMPDIVYNVLMTYWVASLCLIVNMMMMIQRMMMMQINDTCGETYHKGLWQCGMCVEHCKICYTV